MPEQLHPPYGRNTIQPKVLIRWLSINAQNGPLGRTGTYIVIPSFGPVVSGWKGYSDIVAVFDYTAPNNFSISDLPSFNTTDCLVCVSFIVDGETIRYKLNSDVGEVLYFNVDNYTNQRINKNFRIEIWDTSSTLQESFDFSSELIYTSVLGELDYRYGIDGPLCLAGTVNYDFSSDWNLPFVFNGSTGDIYVLTDDQGNTLVDDQGNTITTLRN